jgi:hypothetical protein
MQLSRLLLLCTVRRGIRAVDVRSWEDKSRLSRYNNLIGWEGNVLVSVSVGGRSDGVGRVVVRREE